LTAPSLLTLLDQGAKAWNDWRHEHPDVVPNLRAAFHPYDITLSERILASFDFSRMNLRGAHLDKSNFTDVSFSEADLRQARLSRSVFLECNFHGANLGQIFSSGASFQKVNLSWADLRKAQLFSAQLGHGTGQT
jgi:uncharacterized protein YjbI with pentapeptide repeats